MGPPNVLGLPKPASSISTSRTFGDPAGGSGCPIRFQSGFDPASVLLLTPPNGGRRIGSFVRSGSLILSPPPAQHPPGAGLGLYVRHHERGPDPDDEQIHYHHNDPSAGAW